MTTIADLRHLAATDWVNAPVEQWWKHAAALCLAEGAVQIIPGRRSEDVYLLRCWLSIPRRYQGAGPDDGARYDSGNSLLLHHFLQPDDDGALHDHPWDFRSVILAGGYVERRPMWHIDPIDPEALGPAELIDLHRMTGDDSRRLSTDLHTVASIEPDTWTMLQTGPRIRSWFFHPAGQRRVPWREYLGLLGKDVPPPRAATAAS